MLRSEASTKSARLGRKKIGYLQAGVVTQAKANALVDKWEENTSHILLESTRRNAGFLK
jgi:hypothetical protein